MSVAICMVLWWNLVRAVLKLSDCVRHSTDFNWGVLKHLLELMMEGQFFIDARGEHSKRYLLHFLFPGGLRTPPGAL